jgi:periplasmic copper chaperone A
MLAALAALAACGAPAANETDASHKAQAPSGPIVRLNPVPGRPAAGYFTLRIEGDKGALVSVTSPQAGRIELHETMREGTMSRMRAIPRLPLRDGETLVFAPGGRHLMLFDLAPTVEAGGEMILTFQFERGAEQRLTAQILATGDAH